MSKNKLPKTFCPQPFQYVYPNHRGSWKPCCKTINWPQKLMDFNQWWYEDGDLHQLRKSLITGEESKIYQRTCSVCLEPESAGVKSYRQHQLESLEYNNQVDNMLEIINNFTKTDQVMTKKRTFVIKVRGFGNECNLKCYMCIPHNSSSKNTEMLKGSDPSLDVFFEGKSKERAKEILMFNKKISLHNEKTKKQMYDVIDELGPSISSLNLSGGEPVMIYEYYNLLDRIIENGNNKTIGIFMNTNCSRTSLKDKDMLDYIPKFNVFDVQGSIDDIYERDEWIRYPSNFKTVVETAKKYTKFNNCQFAVNITWSLLNIYNAENIINFFESEGLVIVPNTNIVNDPKCLHPANHPLRDDMIARYSKSNNYHIQQLSKALKSRDHNKQDMQLAFNYIKDLDIIRKTKSYKIFPELAEHLK